MYLFLLFEHISFEMIFNLFQLNQVKWAHFPEGNCSFETALRHIFRTKIASVHENQWWKVWMPLNTFFLGRVMVLKIYQIVGGGGSLLCI